MSSNETNCVRVTLQNSFKVSSDSNQTSWEICSWCGSTARKAHLRKHFPRIQVLQEYLLGVNQLLWSAGAADILKSLPFSSAAKLDILIQICPLTQDAPQVAWPRDAHHLENKHQLLVEVDKQENFCI